MKQEKYRLFLVRLINGAEYEVKTASMITERYCELLAYHIVNKQHGTNLSPSDVLSVKGIIKQY